MSHSGAEFLARLEELYMEEEERSVLSQLRWTAVFQDRISQLRK